MITLDRTKLTNILVENIDMFSNFAIVQNYCNTRELPSGAEDFLRLTQQIESSKDLHDLIAKCISSNFKLDKNFEILNGFQLATLIRNMSIEISEGEESWIQNLERIQEALKSACCSTRHSLSQEGNSCYAALINQCSSDWIFVKNLKESLNVNKITFKLPDNSEKNV